MKGPFRFCLKAAISPTNYNLSRYLQEQGWCSSPFNGQADFSDENLQFDLQAAEKLEYKHLLAQLAAQYCPEAMPLTYCVNDQNWPQVLNQLATHHYLHESMGSDSIDLLTMNQSSLTPLIHYLHNNQLVNQINNLVWILKPALLNNGKDIKIFQKLTELEQHFLSTQRLGGEHVLQRYLTNPHLLRDERKYSIRMFVIISNYLGSFLYPYGYYNVALHPYAAKDFSDQRSHLTNEHLQDDEVNVLQIPTQRFAAFASLYPQIKTIVTALIKGLEREHPQTFIGNKKRTLAIYGFDFLVDNTGRLWLLEANHGPCFPIADEHPLQRYLYADFWQAFIANFVLPIALNQPKNEISYHSFEWLDTGKNSHQEI